MEHSVHSFMDRQLAAFFHCLFVWIYPALILLNRLFPSLLKNSQFDQGLPPHLQWVIGDRFMFQRYVRIGTTCKFCHHPAFFFFFFRPLFLFIVTLTAFCA